MSELNDSRKFQFTMIYGVLLFLSLKMVSGILAMILYELSHVAGLQSGVSDWLSLVLAAIICVLLAYLDTKGTTKKVRENPDRIRKLTYQMAGVFLGVCFIQVLVLVANALFLISSTGEYITASYAVEYSAGSSDLGKIVLSAVETVLILLAIGIKK